MKKHVGLVQMKMIVRGIVVLLLTFVVGVSANHVFNRVYIRFETVATGSIVLPPAGRGGFASYRASDGTELSFAHLDFPSVEAARSAYQEELTRLKKIIESEPIYDHTGKTIVGARIIGIFSSENGDEWPMMVCWDGRKLYEIPSTSLRHISLFEKAHRRY